MESALVVFVVMVGLPVVALSSVVKPKGNRADAIRFAFSPILLSLCALGLRKLWISPTTPPKFEHALGAIVETLPWIVLLLISGLPGTLYHSSRSKGYAHAMIMLGGCLAWLTTAGDIAKKTEPDIFLPYILGYLVTVIFVLSWAMNRGSINERREWQVPQGRNALQS